MPFKGKSLPLFFEEDCRNIPAQSTIKHCAVMEFQMIEQSVFGEQLREAVRAGRGRNPEYGKRKLTCQSQEAGTNTRQASAAK